MRTNGDTKRQGKGRGQQRREKRDSGERIKRLKSSGIWVMTDTEAGEREREICVFSHAFQLHLDSLARLLIWHSCQKCILNWTESPTLLSARRSSWPLRRRIIGRNGPLPRVRRSAGSRETHACLCEWVCMIVCVHVRALWEDLQPTDTGLLQSHTVFF